MAIARIIGLMVLASVLLWQHPAAVQANGVPVRVILAYLNGVSTWGPTDGTGVAEVAKSEGEVHGSVVGLPLLQDESYEGWLMNTKTGETLAIGSFNTNADKTAVFRYRLPAEIPDRGWNLFLISIERAGTTPTVPSNRRSLAGYFPNQTTEVPQQLPRTGGDTPAALAQPAPAPAALPAAQTDEQASLWAPVAVVAAAALIIGTGAAAVLPRLRRRR